MGHNLFVHNAGSEGQFELLLCWSCDVVNVCMLMLSRLPKKPFPHDMADNWSGGRWCWDALSKSTVRAYTEPEPLARPLIKQRCLRQGGYDRTAYLIKGMTKHVSELTLTGAILNLQILLWCTMGWSYGYVHPRSLGYPDKRVWTRWRYFTWLDWSWIYGWKQRS